MTINVRTTRWFIMSLIAALAVSMLGAGPRAAGSPGEIVSGVVTLQEKPNESHLAVLRALGMQVQGMKQLPMAIVRGTAVQIATALSSGVVVGFYPDEKIVFASDVSNHAIRVDRVHDLGFTGKGLTIAVVDSGIDATHPDLADHVTHNVTIVNPSAQGMQGTPSAPFYVAVDEGPRSNADRGGGHGTLVAGVLAADGTTEPSQVGVAPDAELVGYATSDAVPPALTAFDHILDHPDWGIDIVNNSWGSASWLAYDPGHPVNIATKALTDRGIVVVFAAGNDGAGEAEMTLNAYSVAPWNISAAGSTMNGERVNFSSNGLRMDNSIPVAPTDGHVRFTGNRIGLYHPTVAAPAGPLETSCAAGSVFAFPCVPGRAGTAQGTSFSSPHLAGLAALMRQARPGLTVGEVRETLEATAVEPADHSPFWQIGYGIADAEAALAMVRGPRFHSRLRRAHAAAEARVLAGGDWNVESSDHWTWMPPAATAAGLPDTRDFTLPVPEGTDAIKVTSAFPRLPQGITVGGYSVTVLDADGREVGRTAPGNDVLLDLRQISPAFGAWTLHIEGTLGYNDDRAHQRVTVVATTLNAKVEVPPIVALAFIPDPTRTTGALSPEGCEIEAGEPRGALAESSSDGACHSALAAAGSVSPAEFTSLPLDRVRIFGGEGRLVLYIPDAAPVPDPVHRTIQYEFDELTAGGEVRSLDTGITNAPAVNGRHEFLFQFNAVAVPSGSRLRFRWLQYDPGSQGLRHVYGGEAYGDSGITLTTGVIDDVPQSPSERSIGGIE